MQYQDPLQIGRTTTNKARHCVNVGIKLLALKNALPNGEFCVRYEALGFSRTSAFRFMAIANLFHNAPDAFFEAVGIPSKLFELKRLGDEECDALVRGETVHGLTLEQVAQMTGKELRGAVDAALDGQVGVPILSARTADWLSDEEKLRMGVGAALDEQRPEQVPVGVAMQREHHAEYCRRLGQVITRYLTASELQAYGEHLEAFVAQVTAGRPAQGLHDASYHLRLRFKMPPTTPKT